MSATDELRRLLDERGVEYDGSFGGVEFHGEYGSVVVACNSKCKDDVLYVHAYLAPEQAVEATLGRGTCCDAAGKQMAFFSCSACGATTERKHPRFCFACGRKVVDE